MTLLDIASNESQLKRVGRAEWSGPCPGCGGNDRFSVVYKNAAWLWVCRGCSDGRYHDEIDYYRHFYNLSFAEAKSRRDGALPAVVRLKPRSKPTKRPTPVWKGWDRAAFRARFPYVEEAWRGYKTIPSEMANRYNLGHGMTPASRCHHNRLLVPMFAGGRLVNIRGRRLACDCPKWVSSGGWSLDSIPLFNCDEIVPGSVVVIGENPIDAIMGMTERGQARLYNLVYRELLPPALTTMLELAHRGKRMFSPVATLSTSYWRNEWTQSLIAAQPSQVIIAYDNDLPGNGGGRHRSQALRDWQKTHPKNLPPKSRGPLLANRLREDGLPITLLQWESRRYGTDIGDILGDGSS